MANIKEYFPKLYQGVLETDILIEVENNLFNTLEKEFNRVLLNQFVNSCDVETIIKYENLFSIVPDSSKDITFRRSRILNRLAMSNSFTLRFLEEKLNELIGIGRYTIEIDYTNYTLYIESVSLDQDWFNETYITINKIKPANMIFINRPRIDNRILINEEASYGQREYNYRLGTRWNLGRKPFKSINDKGMIKMAAGKSLTEELLSGLRGVTLDKIHHIRINGKLDIDTFITKEIQDKKITIKYAVLKSNLQGAITKVELMDVNNKVLSVINVYIPVIEDIEVKHILKVEEGVNING